MLLQFLQTCSLNKWCSVPQSTPRKAGDPEPRPVVPHAGVRVASGLQVRAGRPSPRSGSRRASAPRGLADGLAVRLAAAWAGPGAAPKSAAAAPAPTFTYESGGPKADSSDSRDPDERWEHRAASVPALLLCRLPGAHTVPVPRARETLFGAARPQGALRQALPPHPTRKEGSQQGDVGWARGRVEGPSQRPLATQQGAQGAQVITT